MAPSTVFFGNGEISRKRIVVQLLKFIVLDTQTSSFSERFLLKLAYFANESPYSGGCPIHLVVISTLIETPSLRRWLGFLKMDQILQNKLHVYIYIYIYVMYTYIYTYYHMYIYIDNSIWLTSTQFNTSLIYPTRFPTVANLQRASAPTFSPPEGTSLTPKVEGFRSHELVQLEHVPC